MYFVFNNDENRWMPGYWNSFDDVPLRYRGSADYTVYMKCVGPMPPL